MFERETYVNRKNAPPVTIYFVNDDARTPPYKLRCMFCKRTFADNVTGQMDKIVDAPVPAEDHDLALNLQCKLCGQKWRILAAAKSVPATYNR
jgi:hypothetical protein